MTTTTPLILLALLCCVMGCTATASPKLRCMHDKIAKNNRGAMPATIVEPGPDKSGVQGAAKTAVDPAWKAIRIQTFSEDLNSASRYCTAEGQIRPTFSKPSETAKCTAVDILTDQKKSQLRTVMIPSAMKLHSDRLLVQPLTGNIIVGKFNFVNCDSFTIPQSHKTVGVAGADMVVYVAAGPTGDASASAIYCSTAPNGRPVTGVINVGPDAIDKKDKNIRLVAHEIGHALGFDYDIMDKLKMVTIAYDIRGQTRLVVSTSLTLSKTKAHYNCNSIAGMELENEGDDATAKSHWERRNARDDLMASDDGAAYYSAITMAFFEDLKYYRANWGKEETMEWGRNAGCPFLKEKCVSNGKTKYPGMFCTEVTSDLLCTFDRKALGRCTLKKYGYRLPVQFQYFADPTLGGSGEHMEYCPDVDRYDDTGCTDGDPSGMPGSLVGPKSMCLQGEGLRVKVSSNKAARDICAEVTCDKNTVRVRYLGDNTWYPCPEKTKITPKGAFAAGQIVCPRRADVCRTN